MTTFVVIFLPAVESCYREHAGVMLVYLPFALGFTSGEFSSRHLLILLAAEGLEHV